VEEPIELTPGQGDSALVKAVGRKLSNWGRWGPEDQLGTLNFITPEKVAAACRIPVLGKTYSLSLPYTSRGPMNGKYGRTNPARHSIVSGADAIAGSQRLRLGSAAAADDLVIMQLQSSTQWDALSHIFYDNLAYNGLDVSRINSFGAERLGVEVAAYSAVTTRGVLVDIELANNFDGIPERYLITADDLDRSLERSGTEMEPGDLLLIRTGWLAKFYSRGARAKWKGYFGENREPGLSWTVAPWLAEKQVAALAMDTPGIELQGEIEDEAVPLHMILIRDMGMMLGEMWFLDELASACAADGRYEVLVCAPPLPFESAFGSPVNAIALK
jgi:kynurenine formamidase